MRETSTAPTLLTFYAGWERYQRSLVEMLADLTPEQLALPVGSHRWTVGEVAQHMVGNRVWWFQIWMGEGDPALAPLAHWDPADADAVGPQDAAALVAGLAGTWAMIRDALDRWTAADLPERFAPPAALREEERALYPPCTRQWMIWHTLEHEIHHGGELSIALGDHGLPGVYGAM